MLYNHTFDKVYVFKERETPQSVPAIDREGNHAMSENIGGRPGVPFDDDATIAYNPLSDSSQGSISPSDTAAFLAIAAQLDPSVSQKMQSVAPAAETLEPTQAQPVAKPRQQPSAPSRPVAQSKPASGATINPLVAAREANAAAESAATGNLYPINAASQDQHTPVGKEFDPSFKGDKPKGGHKALVAFVVIILLAALLVAGFFLLRMYMNNSAHENVGTASAQIETADAVVDPLTQAIQYELSNGVPTPDLTSSMLSSQTASTALTNAYDAVRSGATIDLLLDADAKGAVDAVTSAVDARRDIISIGRSLLIADSSANEALTNLEAVHAAISDASSRASDVFAANDSFSAAFYNNEDTSAWNMQSYADSAAYARDEVSGALNNIAAARTAYPEVDYAPYENYLNSYA